MVIIAFCCFIVFIATLWSIGSIEHARVALKSPFLNQILYGRLCSFSLKINSNELLDFIFNIESIIRWHLRFKVTSLKFGHDECGTDECREPRKLYEMQLPQAIQIKHLPRWIVNWMIYRFKKRHQFDESFFFFFDKDDAPIVCVIGTSWRSCVQRIFITYLAEVTMKKSNQNEFNAYQRMRWTREYFRQHYHNRCR